MRVGWETPGEEDKERKEGNKGGSCWSNILARRQIHMSEKGTVFRLLISHIVRVTDEEIRHSSMFVCGFYREKEDLT